MLIGVSAYPNPAADKLYKNLVQDNKLANYFRVNDEIFLLLLIIKGEALILKDLWYSALICCMVSVSPPLSG